MMWGGCCRALLAFHRLNHKQSCNMAVSVMEVPKRGGGWTRWSGSQTHSCFQLTAALARTLAALIQMHQRKEEISPFVIRWLCRIRLFHQNSACRLVAFQNFCFPISLPLNIFGFISFPLRFSFFALHSFPFSPFQLCSLSLLLQLNFSCTLVVFCFLTSSFNYCLSWFLLPF